VLELEIEIPEARSIQWMVALVLGSQHNCMLEMEVELGMEQADSRRS
jgi:hypothetical protein